MRIVRERRRPVDPLAEGAFRRAGRDTLERVESVRGVALEIGASAACSALVGVWLANWQGSPWIAAAMTFGAGVAGFVLVLVVFGAVSVALAPVRQRNEARALLAEWEARSVDLPAALESLLREGAGMLILFPQEAPVAGEEGAYAVEFLPSSKYKEQVSAFDLRVRALLMEQRPSLLPTYAAGSNDFLERAREKQDAREQRLAAADAAARLRELVDFNHRWPAVELEACLRGLADARNQLGHDDRAPQPSRSRAS